MGKGGDKFWTGAKRFPRAAGLDIFAEPQHAAFVTSTANLLAAGYGVSPPSKGLLPPDHPQRNAEGHDDCPLTLLDTLLSCVIHLVCIGITYWEKPR